MTFEENYLQNMIYQILSEKSKNNLVGFTNGCFDLLHKGHEYILKESKKNCDFLIVGINSDSSVKQLKGKDRPIESEKERIRKLESLDFVDKVIVFTELTPLNLIKTIKPDVLIKGSDYNEDKIVGSDFIKSYGGKVVIIDLLEGYSTTNIINKREIK